MPKKRNILPTPHYEDMPNVVKLSEIKEVGAPINSVKFSDDGPMGKGVNRLPPHPLDYYGGFDGRIQPMPSKNEKKIDWLTLAIGFLCGSLTMWMLLRP